MADYVEIGVDLKLRDFAALTRVAVDDLAQRLDSAGRQDMASVGLGRSARSRSTKTTVRSLGGGNYEIGLHIWPSYLRVYEYGGVSVGRPLLWMPVNMALPVRARNYAGRLFRPRGTRVLMAPGRQVRYVGVARIVHTPRLHLSDIAAAEAKQFLQRLQEQE